MKTEKKRLKWMLQEICNVSYQWGPANLEAQCFRAGWGEDRTVRKARVWQLSCGCVPVTPRDGESRAGAGAGKHLQQGGPRRTCSLCGKVPRRQRWGRKAVPGKRFAVWGQLPGGKEAVEQGRGEKKEKADGCYQSTLTADTSGENTGGNFRS